MEKNQPAFGNPDMWKERLRERLLEFSPSYLFSPCFPRKQCTVTKRLPKKPYSFRHRNDFRMKYLKQFLHS